MILGFENFHPLRGELTPEFREICGDIVYRARALLSQRSEKEIFAAIEIINWMIDQSPAPSPSKDEVFIRMGNMLQDAINGVKIPTAETVDNWLTRHNIYTATYALKARQAKYDITEDEKFPNASWAELFAVMALSLIDQANRRYTFRGGPYKEENPHADRLFYELGTVMLASNHLIEAMDAVATAEGIRRFESGINDTKQKIKVRNKHAAIQRHAKTNEAIVALRDFYFPEKHKSMRNAAQLFVEAFPDKVAHLAHYNRVRTLSEGLSNYLKERRLSLQQ